MDQLDPYDSYGLSWSVRRKFIENTHTDQVDPYTYCGSTWYVLAYFIHKPTSYYGSSTLYLIRMLNPVTYPKANLLNPYVDQLKHITNQKTSSKKNHGEKSLTSTSAMEHILNAVKAKL